MTWQALAATVALALTYAALVARRGWNKPAGQHLATAGVAVAGLAVAVVEWAVSGGWWPMVFAPLWALAGMYSLAGFVLAAQRQRWGGTR